MKAFSMKRNEAINVLKEISALCHALDTYHIMLMPPNADDVHSKGNQLHIKANLDEKTRNCIKPILEKYGLTMVQEENLLVIYRSIT